MIEKFCGPILIYKLKFVMCCKSEPSHNNFWYTGPICIQIGRFEGPKYLNTPTKFN